VVEGLVVEVPVVEVDVPVVEVQEAVPATGPVRTRVP
jgi:hypothetical protein